MTENVFQKIQRHLQVRRSIFLQGDYLSLFERLWLIAHLQMALPALQLAGKRLKTDAVTSEPYFHVGPYKIYFQPQEKPKNYDYFLRGMRQVVAESFIVPSLFWGPVKVNNGDTVLDLGGNIGTTALLLSSQVGVNGGVIAFEPVTFATIEKNILINGISNVVVVPKAVSNQIGEVEIEVSDFTLDSTITKRESTGERHLHFSKKLRIPTITLDEYVFSQNLNRLDFIKMDIEGAEEWALEGAKETIKKYHPKWSISSYHTDFKNEKQHPKLVKIMKAHGYNVREQANSHLYAW